MKLSKKMKGENAVLTLRGEFDSFVCAPFNDQIKRLSETGVNTVVINMKLVKFINSTGIGSMIKSRRDLRANNGDLVISDPSPFVKEALESLGLTDVLKIFDTDQEALSHIEKTDGVELDNGNNVMVHPIEEAGSPIIGRIRKLDENSIYFETEEEAPHIKTNRVVRLKFRLPLFRKSHYFDITAHVLEVVHSTTGIMVSTRFDHIFEEDRESISQFVKDMQFLRNEARD